MKESIKIPEGVEELKISQESGRVIIEFVPKFKEGDFVCEDGRIMIVEEYPSFYKALISPSHGTTVCHIGTVYLSLSPPVVRFATEEEKKILLDALKKEGKRWNAEKLCIEDIPQRKFKPGDKVKLKDGMLDKRGESPYFTPEMDVFIGKVLTVRSYTPKGSIFLNEAGYWAFAEAWLEPYSDEPIVGELAIFWDSCKEYSRIRLYTQHDTDMHRDHLGEFWENAIKYISKEQFLKHIKQ